MYVMEEEPEPDRFTPEQISRMSQAEAERFLVQSAEKMEKLLKWHASLQVKQKMDSLCSS